MNIEEIWQKFINIENKRGLFDEKVCGIYFWKTIRFQLYQFLLVKYGHVQTINDKIKVNKMFLFFNTAKNSFLYSAFNDKTQTNVLIFEHPRKKRCNDIFYDPYTKYFVNKIDRENINYQIIDEGFRGRHYERASNIRLFAENIYFDIFRKILYDFNSQKLHEKENKLIKLISRELFKVYGFEVPLESIVKSNIRKFFHQWDKYQKLFSLKKPEKIYLVCSYGKEGMIHAAKEMGIEVMEFQHGTMSKYHMGYSFPGHMKIPYFPDKIMMFGKYWYDSTPLPLGENSVEYIGYEELNLEIERKADIVKDDRKILFISQWTVGKQLSIKAVETAKNNRNYNIIYRLHPGEIDLWKKNYQELFKNRNLDNLTVHEENSNLYNQLKTSLYVIGVYSTVIFEALALNCKVILFDMPGIEYVERLVEKNLVIKKKFDEVLSFAGLPNVHSIDREYLFGSIHQNKVRVT